ncbi:hypothetical protein BDQ17DRAFT_1351946 [Cyathus striatus]|nr:hypothetical protein BDQ17DRAFT_1351946 [Cyathus striatus]
MQYLFLVRRDARYLPHVTRVANPYETPESEQSFIPSDSVGTHPELPSDEWRGIFERRFRNFRKNLDQPTIHVNVHMQRRLMPDKKERDLWWAFLSGKPESDWNPPSKPKKQSQAAASGNHISHQGMRPASEFMVATTDEGEVEQELKIDPGESLPTPSGTPGPETSQSTSFVVLSSNPEPLVPREPSTVLLRQIDERMALHLLMYFTHWMNLHLQNPDPLNYLLTEVHARWIFALLSRIDDHISADDMNLLRNLTRACLAWLKSSIQERTMAVQGGPLGSAPSIKRGMGGHACWLIISIIVSIWKQRDLWMDAEQILRSVGPTP